MKVVLHSIELENFKTYAGKVTIGPFKSFTAVIGPNGTGKSNLLDAISFAFGEKVSNLRVKQLSDLIYGAHVGKPVSQKASVTLNFRYEDGTSIHFTRTVVKSVQHYLLDEESVSCACYLSKLDAIGFNIKAKNFLVYQGMVETIALMDPKQRTNLFEEISGSKTLKKEYDTLKNQMTQMEDVTQVTYLKQRSFRSECKEAKLERNEALKHEKLENELDEKYIQLQLFKLLYIEKEQDRLEKKHAQYTTEIKNTKLQMANSANLLEEREKNLSDENLELVNIEKEIQTKEALIKELEIPLVKFQQEKQHMQKKVETAVSSLSKAREVQRKHLDTIKSLEKELSTIEIERIAFEEKIAEESISQGKNIVLEESQAREYNMLKGEVANRSASIQQKIESLLRKQKADQDILDGKMQQFSDTKDKIKRKCLVKDEGSERYQKLLDRIDSIEKNLKESTARRQLLSANSDSCKENIASIQKELEDINSQLNDAQADGHELKHRKKKLQAVQTLKGIFPGVQDRLINLCEPVHQKFIIAITKIMGKNMHAIVVDTEKTARCCIAHLKTRMMDPETFLPLDFLKVKPLKEYLRQKTSKHCYVLFDVLRFPPEIERAVLFATKSVLVCETTEEAHKVHESDRLDVVSLDGTYFQKSGLISGGTADLAKKAKQWDGKQVVQMQAQKDALSEKLRCLIKESRCELELNDVELEVTGFKSRIGFMKADLDKSSKNISVADEELGRLRETLEILKPQINEIKDKIEERGHKLKTLEDNLCTIEDEVFAEFCITIGVPTIQAYEKAGLRSFEDSEKQRQEFEDRKSRISSSLEYENENYRDSISNNIKRWTDEVRLRKDAVRIAESTAKDYLKRIQSTTYQLEELKKGCAKKQEHILDLKKEVDDMQKNARASNESLRTMKRQQLDCLTKINNCNSKRISIGLHCHVKGIELPFVKGSLKLFIPEGSDASSSSSTAVDSGESFSGVQEIVFNYDSLASDLKELETAASIKEHEAKLNENILNLANKLHLMNVPNNKALEKLEETTGKLKDTNIEFERIRKQSKKVRDKFEKVKKDRCDLFNDCVDYVSNEIDVIYKQMTQSTSAMALLTWENQEEPYLGGTSYCCIAPGKACKPMHSLSGGEKTVASIALLIALHQYRYTPCLILDEVDAALDNANIAMVANYFSNNKDKFQTVAISLRPEFFCHADGLVGVTAEDGEVGHESVTFLYDLEAHPK